MRDGARWARLLASLWLGAMLAVASIATPSAFAVLPRADAGRVAGRILVQEAYLSLALAVVLILLERAAARRTADAGKDTLFSTNLLLLLGAVFCTVAGHFGVLPMMADARAGVGRLSFGQLHAISSSFYAVKVALVAALAWRLSRAPSSSR
jgi:chromate transport protein ChrA